MSIFICLYLSACLCNCFPDLPFSLVYLSFSLLAFPSSFFRQSNFFVCLASCLFLSQDLPACESICPCRLSVSLLVCLSVHPPVYHCFPCANRLSTNLYLLQSTYILSTVFTYMSVCIIVRLLARLFAVMSFCLVAICTCLLAYLSLSACL